MCIRDRQVGEDRARLGALDALDADVLHNERLDGEGRKARGERAGDGEAEAGEAGRHQEISP